MGEPTDGTGTVSLQQHTDAQTWSTPETNQFAQYFGPPSGPIHTNPYDKFGYTNFDLPDAYKGKNLFLRDTIDGFILEDNTWFTSVCLPYVRTDQHHFAWNEWHFDTHLVGRVPEEGVSRLIRSSKRSFKESTVRRGIAFQLEHGFMNTPEGRQQYVMNLRQIQQSVQETANHDVIGAVLSCRRYDREWEKKHGHFQKSFPEVMKREVNQWAIAQKHPNGLDYMHEEFKGRLARWKVSPDMWIFPPKLCLYLSMVPPEKTKFMEVGPEGPAKFNQGAQALSSFRGVQVYETREFDVFEGDLPIDLLRRKQQIGEYYVMHDPYRYASDAEVKAKYRSEHRDIVIYDEDKDGWQRISFSDALKNARNHQGSEDPLDGTAAEGDIFYVQRHKGMPNETKTRLWFLGEMQEKHLSIANVRRAAHSMAKQMGEGPNDGEHGIAAVKAHYQNIAGLHTMYNWSGGESAEHVRMFKRASAGATGPTLASVGAAVQTAGLDNAFVGDMVRRISDPADQQRFLSGLHNSLSDVSAQKSTKNLYKAMVKKAPKRDSEVVNWLQQSPFWHAEAAVSTAGGDEWVSTSETWKAEYEGHPDWRAGDPATNYTTAAPVAYTPSSGGSDWDSTPWVIAAKAASQPSDTRGFAPMSSASQFSRNDISDILGSDAASKMARIGDCMVNDKSFAFDTQGDEIGVWRKDGAGNLSAPGGDALGHVRNNDRQKALWNAFDKETTVHHCAHVFLGILADVEHLEKLAKQNVWIPFNVVLVRPHMTYDMCSAVLMKGGMETGMTAVGHNDFQLGDDVASKMHYGHYTFKSKAFVQQPRNIIIAENVFAQGYVRGTNSTKMNTTHVPTERKEAMWSWLVSYGGEEGVPNYPNPIDLKGNFDTDDASQGVHIKGGDYYHSAWKTNPSARDDGFLIDVDSGQEFLENTEGTLNTVCYQGHQFSYSRKNDAHTVVTRNTGHWGANVYPGCGAVRAGEAQCFRDMNYVDCAF